MCFYELPNEIKTCLIALLLLFNLLQFSYAVLLIQNRKKGRAILHMCLMSCLIFMIPFLAENLRMKNSLGEVVKLEHVLFLYLIIWPTYAYLLIREYREGMNILGKNAVKEAIDKLPVAICFFSLDGLPVLCNMKMYSLAYTLLGKDLQMISELKECLEMKNERVQVVGLGDDLAYQLQDQTIWHFTQIDVLDAQDREYVQVVGTDVTSLYHLQDEFNQRNIDLQNMLKQIQNISDNIADIVRSNEVLLAKERVHSKMGSSLLVARRYFMGNCKRSEKQQFMEAWKETIDSLQNEIEADDGDSAFDELIHLAKGIGVDIKLEGDMPKEEKTREIIVCGIRENLTNVVKHGAGSCLQVRITHGQQEIQVEYTNDGRVPEREIVEGGGLSMLRNRVEKVGGSMLVEHAPRFLLRMIIPKRI